MSAPEMREERETAKAPAPAPRRSLVRRGVRDVVQGYALWLLYRWLVHGMDEVSPGMRELLALFVVVALWVCVAGFLRGRADRQARRTAVVAAAVAVGAFVTVVAARPAPTALAELPTPAVSALMLALAGGLGLWVRYAEPRGRS